MTDEPLSKDQADVRLEGVIWKEETREDGTTAMVREVELENFQAAVDLLVRIAALAETANHHPDFLLHGWNKLKLTLSTHDADGLTSKDFDLAGQIDQLINAPQEAG